MTTALEEKIKILSNWYDNHILKNRLFLTVEGSENLQSIFLNSTVVNFYVQSDYKYSLVLTNEMYGLFQIVFFPFNDIGIMKKVSLRPFTSFSDIFEDYLSVNLDANPIFNDLSPYSAIYFDFSDILVMENLFKSNFDDLVGLIKDANDGLDETINLEMNDEGLLIDSPKQRYIKIKKEIDDTFFKKHSNALLKTNRLKRKMDLKRQLGAEKHISYGYIPLEAGPICPTTQSHITIFLNHLI